MEESDVCTDASEMGFAFAVREGCRELASEVGRFLNEQGSREASGPSVPSRVRFAPSLRMSIERQRPQIVRDELCSGRKEEKGKEEKRSEASCVSWRVKTRLATHC